MTPQEIQGAISGGGQHSGTLGGGAALLGAGSRRVFVHRMGDGSALGGHPCRDGGHQDDTTGWVSPLGGTGGSQQPLAQLVAPRSGPQPCRSPSSRNHRSRQTLAGSPLNVTNTV